MAIQLSHTPVDDGKGKRDPEQNQGIGFVHPYPKTTGARNGGVKHNGEGHMEEPGNGGIMQN